jgi:hypothetical protein
MMSTKRIVEVAGETALTISERVPGYRVALVRALVDAIQVQVEGLSDKGRRDKIGKVVEGLGSRIATEQGEA